MPGPRRGEDYSRELTFLETLMQVSRPFWVATVGAQGGLPQDIAQWHIDYFELKLLKKLLVQEENPDLSIPLKAGDKSPMW